MATRNPKDDQNGQNHEFLEIEDLNLEEEPVYGRSTNKANILVKNGAIMEISAAAVDITGRVSRKNDLGTDHPSEMLFGVVKGRKAIAGIPVKPDTPGATKIKHKGGRAYGTLFPLFAKLDRLVEEGYKERYFVKETEGKVTIKGVTGYAIYIDLVTYEKEPIQKLSEEERAKRRATLAAKKAAKEAAANKPSEESAPSALEIEEPEDEE